MTNYLSYGMVLASNLRLPHFPEARVATSDGAIDFQTSRAEYHFVPPGISAGIARMTVPRIATFDIEAGQHVRIRARPGVEGQIETLLYGAPLAALLDQRGFVVLRGGVATDGRRTLLFTGAGGHGVSTVLLELAERDWVILSDAFVPLRVAADGGPVMASVGPPFVRVWRDAALRVAASTPLIDPVRAGLSCYWVRVRDDAWRGGGVPVTGIVDVGLWNRAASQGVMPRGRALERLLQRRYHPWYTGRPSAIRQMQVLETLARQVRVGWRRQPWRPFTPMTGDSSFFDLIDILHEQNEAEA